MPSLSARARRLASSSSRCRASSSCRPGSGSIGANGVGVAETGLGARPAVDDDPQVLAAGAERVVVSSSVGACAGAAEPVGVLDVEVEVEVDDLRLSIGTEARAASPAVGTLSSSSSSRVIWAGSPAAGCGAVVSFLVPRRSLCLGLPSVSGDASVSSESSAGAAAAAGSVTSACGSTRMSSSSSAKRVWWPWLGLIATCLLGLPWPPPSTSGRTRLTSSSSSLMSSWARMWVSAWAGGGGLTDDGVRTPSSSSSMVDRTAPSCCC